MSRFKITLKAVDAAFALAPFGRKHSGKIIWRLILDDAEREKRCVFESAITEPNELEAVADIWAMAGKSLVDYLAQPDSRPLKRRNTKAKANDKALI